MKKLLSIALAAAMLFSAAGCGQKSEPELTAEERTQLYSDAITAARGEEENEAFPVLTDAEDPSAPLIMELVGLAAEDAEAFALSVSPMNVNAYGIAVVMPAEGKADAVLAGFQGFVELQQRNFEMYLPDQKVIADAAKVETLSDGTVVMVMCENADAVYESIQKAVEG